MPVRMAYCHGRGVVDETREAERISTWDNPEEIIAAVNGYRKNYWVMQPNWVEVWSEKGTIRGTLAPVLRKYGVTFRVMHGYGSATALHGIAEETADNDKALTVLYVGDWGRAGCKCPKSTFPTGFSGMAGPHPSSVWRWKERTCNPAQTCRFSGHGQKQRLRYGWFLGERLAPGAGS